MALKKVEEKEEKDLQTVETQKQSDGNPFEASEPMMKQSDVEKLIAGLRAEFDNKLSNELKKKEIKDGDDYSSDIIDDWMEEPAVFFSYVSGYFLPAYIKNGREVKCPNGKGIKFKNVVRKKTSGGSRGTTIVTISVAKIHSKRDKEFLENSDLFGVTYHRSINEALSVDAIQAQSLINANQTVSRMNEHDVIQACNRRGIGLVEDLSLMRRKLTAEMAKEQQKRVDDFYEKERQKIASMEEGLDGERRTVIPTNAPR